MARRGRVGGRPAPRRRRGRPSTRSSADTPLENGYGARQVLSWLVTGELLDAGRFPVVTVLAGIGLVVCVPLSPDPTSRALIVPAGDEPGPVLRADHLRVAGGDLPGSTDIFMRRFMMGIQLAGALLGRSRAWRGRSSSRERLADRRWPPRLDLGAALVRRRW